MTALDLQHGHPQPGDDLSQLARQANEELADASATEILTWASETFGSGLVLTSSLADTVMIHLAEQVAPGVDVLFLDTGYHFAETLGTRDAYAAMLPIRMRTVLPLRTVAEQDAEYGPKLHDRDPDRCCALRKVEPLERALSGYDAWAAGVRRGETAARANVREVDYEASRGKVKVAPLARWTDADVAAYIERYDIPVNQLLQAGYGSIGCWPCTRKVRPGEDPRAGRWAAFDKTECGLHR